MSEKYQLPSESDEDDDDYIPEGPSGSSEADSDIDREIDDDNGVLNHKNKVHKRCKKISNKVSKRIKKNEIPLSSGKLLVEDEENDSKIQEHNVEEEKKRSDSLWADFLKDSAVLSKSKNSTEKSICGKAESNSTNSKIDNKIKVTEIVEFAGEKLEIEKEVFPNSTKVKLSVPNSENKRNDNISPAIKSKQSNDLGTRKVGVGGISAVLGRLGKKTKISTLEKSKLDWDNFKRQEDIEEEISTHNKGKDGYLEKQDFLQRADFRQFEIEKQLRTSRRSNR